MKIKIMLKSKLLSSKKVWKTYKVLRAICGSMRFKILVLLKENKAGLTVSEMSDILRASASRLSHQLRILKKNNLVYGTGKNREVIYKLQNHYIRRVLNF